MTPGERIRYGKRIRELREKAGRELDDVALAIGVSGLFFESVEDGQRERLSPERTAALAKELGVAVSELDGPFPVEESPKLWLVRDLDRWGYSLNVVRASTREAAQALVSPNSKHIEIEELPIEGPPAIVWCHDHSPDSPRDR